MFLSKAKKKVKAWGWAINENSWLPECVWQVHCVSGWNSKQTLFVSHLCNVPRYFLVVIYNMWWLVFELERQHDFREECLEPNASVAEGCGGVLKIRRAIAQSWLDADTRVVWLLVVTEIDTLWCHGGIWKWGWKFNWLRCGWKVIRKWLAELWMVYLYGE